MARLLRSRSTLAAAVPAVAIVLAVGWLSVGRAAPLPDLPSVSPRTLIASTLHAVANRTPVSGTVKTHVDLGIPQLPSSLSDPAGPAAILLADQTFKVWYGPDGIRVAQILPFAERDLVSDRSDVWFWDAQRFMAAYRTETPHAATNVGYLAGYHDSETARRIWDWFECAHPVFGTYIPTPEEAFEAGQRLGAESATKE